MTRKTKKTTVPTPQAENHTVVKQTITIKKDILEQLYMVQARMVTETRHPVSFSAALDAVLRKGLGADLKPKGSKKGRRSRK